MFTPCNLNLNRITHNHIPCSKWGIQKHDPSNKSGRKLYASSTVRPFSSVQEELEFVNIRNFKV
jgi:hypothetical protein